MYHGDAARGSLSAEEQGRTFGARAAIIAVVFFVGCAKPSAIERALSLMNQHRDEEATKVLETRIAAAPDDLEAHALLVRAYGTTSNLGAAKMAAERMRKRLPPGDPRPELELGHAFELAHAFDDALAAYDRAAEESGAAAGPREGGLRAAHWGLADEAEARLREAYARGARDEEVLHALGLVSVRLGKLDEAERYYRACISLSSAACHLGLASLGLLRHDYALALTGYDGLLHLRPRSGDAALGRSFALIRLGRVKDAELALRDAEAFGASAAHVARQRALLRGEVTLPLDERYDGGSK